MEGVLLNLETLHSQTAVKNEKITRREIPYNIAQISCDCRERKIISRRLIMLFTVRICNIVIADSTFSRLT